MLEFYDIKHSKARKEHVCDLCGSKIYPGQVYERYSGKYDGDLFDLKYCLDCEKIINTFLDENGYDEYSDDDIFDWLQEKFCYDCKHGWHRDDALDDCTFNQFRYPAILEKIKK